MAARHRSHQHSPPAPASSSASSGPTGGVGGAGGRVRAITSCLTCRRRKVRCTHEQPVCSACARGNHACVYANARAAASALGVGGQPHPAQHAELSERLRRLEDMLERAVAGGASAGAGGGASGREVAERQEGEPAMAEQQQGRPRASPAKSAWSEEGGSSDSNISDGTLYMHDGKAHFVSSTHWSSVADEIQELRALLSETSISDDAERKWYNANTHVHSQPHFHSILFGEYLDDVSFFLPNTSDDCYKLFSVFKNNINPMIHIVHLPTVQKRFDAYVKSKTPRAIPTNQDSRLAEANIKSFEPLAFAIMWSAVASLTPEAVRAEFVVEKDQIWAGLRRGLEASLAREDFVVTAKLEVLQALVLFLSILYCEGDISRVWSLMGLAIKLAFSQGLHRDPSSFPPGTMDAIDAEVRRRVWHQLYHLDFRTSEGKGLDFSISEEQFTTELPRNIDDEDLTEGMSVITEEIVETDRFTLMTTQLARFRGFLCFRSLLKRTQQVYRYIANANPPMSSAERTREFRALFSEMQDIIEKELHTFDALLRHCDGAVMHQSFAILLHSLLEVRFWILFWTQIPRNFREAILGPDIRTMVFLKSVLFIENIYVARNPDERAHFFYHAGPHNTFTAIMHILSELHLPTRFRRGVAAAACVPPPDQRQPEEMLLLRPRALVALRAARAAHADSPDRNWRAVTALAERVER
ncbi:fungal-specific transcription factor domain-containing protein, partial [Lineolata rhizophorae]